MKESLGGEESEREKTSGKEYEGQEIDLNGLLTDAAHLLRNDPYAVLPLILVGIVLSGIDWMMIFSPVPTTLHQGVLTSTGFNITVSYHVLIYVIPQATTTLSALVGLEPLWLLLTSGFVLLKPLIIAGAGSYTLARLLRVSLTKGAVLRYTFVVFVVQFGTVNVNFNGVAAVFGLVLLPLVFVVFVRLFALPGFLIADFSIRDALAESWNCTEGYGWSLFGAVLCIGLANDVVASIPMIGSIGSAFIGAIQATVIATFLIKTRSLNHPQGPHFVS